MNVNDNNAPPAQSHFDSKLEGIAGVMARGYMLLAKLEFRSIVSLVSVLVFGAVSGLVGTAVWCGSSTT